MSDLISRQDVINLLCELRIDNISVNGKSIIEYIGDIQKVYDVEKVVAGIEEFYEEAEHYGFKSALSDVVELVKWGAVK